MLSFDALLELGIMLRTYVRLRCSLGRLQITFTKLPVSGTLKCNIKALTGPLFNELDGEDCRMRHLYLWRQNMLAENMRLTDNYRPVGPIIIFLSVSLFCFPANILAPVVK